MFVLNDIKIIKFENKRMNFSGWLRYAKPVGLQTRSRLRLYHLQQHRIRLLLSGMSTPASGWMSERLIPFPRSLRFHCNFSWTQCPTAWKKNIEICSGVFVMTYTISRWKQLVSMVLWTKGWWMHCGPFSTKSLMRVSTTPPTPSTWTTPRIHQVLLSTGLFQAFGFDSFFHQNLTNFSLNFWFYLYKIVDSNI